jgi:hypothetical protein
MRLRALSVDPQCKTENILLHVMHDTAFGFEIKYEAAEVLHAGTKLCTGCCTMCYVNCLKGYISGMRNRT